MAALLSGPLPSDEKSVLHYTKNLIAFLEEAILPFPLVQLSHCGAPALPAFVESHHRAKLLVCAGTGSCLSREENPLLASDLSPCRPVFVTFPSYLCYPT